MTKEREQQIMSALEWGQQSNGRRVSVEVVRGEEPALWVSEWDGPNVSGKFIKPEDGHDFDAAVKADRDKHEREEFERLSKKYGGQS